MALVVQKVHFKYSVKLLREGGVCWYSNLKFSTELDIESLTITYSAITPPSATPWNIIILVHKGKGIFYFFIYFISYSCCTKFECRSKILIYDFYTVQPLAIVTEFILVKYYPVLRGTKIDCTMRKRAFVYWQDTEQWDLINLPNCATGSHTCCTVVFPPFRMEIPSFKVDETMESISPVDMKWGNTFIAVTQATIITASQKDVRFRGTAPPPRN